MATGQIRWLCEEHQKQQRVSVINDITQGPRVKLPDMSTDEAIKVTCAQTFIELHLIFQGAKKKKEKSIISCKKCFFFFVFKDGIHLVSTLTSSCFIFHTLHIFLQAEVEKMGDMAHKYIQKRSTPQPRKLPAWESDLQIMGEYIL